MDRPGLPPNCFLWTFHVSPGWDVSLPEIRNSDAVRNGLLTASKGVLE